MKSGFLSRRQRNPQRHREPGKEQAFFSKSNDAQKQPFFKASPNDNHATIQAKLSIGQPGDKYEQEADRVADQVVSSQNTGPSVQKQEISSIQRTTLTTPTEDEKLSTAENRMEKDKLVQEKTEVQQPAASEEEEPIQKMAAPTEEEEAPVQKKAVEPEKEEAIQQKAAEEEEPLQKKTEPAHSNTASSQLGTQLQNTKGKGHPLANPTRSNMEQAFDTDFGSVNVHTDTTAMQMNQELGAQAFTHGQDVYFNAGKYNPDHTEGEKLLAHELTHVVQQGGAKRNIQRKQNNQAQTGGKHSTQEEARTQESEENTSAVGSVCPTTNDCPEEFCTPFANRTMAETARTASRNLLLFGISRAVNPRVVPFWRQHIDGGTGLQNLDSTFGTDFSSSPTTATTTSFLMDAIATHLINHPPTFPPGTNSLVLNIGSLIPAVIAEIDNPSSSNQMNFNVIGDIAGNIAGGIGKDQLSCPAGAMPSPQNDSRAATGGVLVIKNADGTLTIFPQFQFQVKDTIDLCPGNCGDMVELAATIPLSKFEASGISGDVPFEVNFPAPLLSRTITPNAIPVAGNSEGLTTASQLHIREAPSTSAPILGRYPRGSRVHIICSTTGTSVQGVNTWYQTDRGFISGRYVQLYSNNASIIQC